jgi:peptidoglycan-binding protein ArfA
MTGSGDAQVSATATEWRTESRFYRRSPGLPWLLGLLLIPLLFGWLGWGALKPKVDISAPSVGVTAPSLSLPSLNLAPLSILRNGNDFTLTGELPDLATKNTLLAALTGALGSGVNLIDKLTITAGVSAADLTGIAPEFTAAADIKNFGFELSGNTLTLTGTAPSEEIKAGVEASAKAGWPNVQVVNNIVVQGADATGSCGNLQSSIDSALRTPITYETDGATLTPGAKAELTAIANAIKVCPDARITVIGHTDNTGNDAINFPLSINRADSVADYLVSQGVSAVSVVSKGEGSSNPVAGNDTADGRAQNRRTEITVN